MKILQKCPSCGQWCVAEYNGVISGFIRRIGSGWLTGVENAGDVGEIIGESLGFGNEKLSNVTGFLGAVGGGAVGGYTGMLNAVSNAIAGDKFQFKCDNCGSRWSTDDEDDDQSAWYEQEQEVIRLRNAFVQTNDDDYNDYIFELDHALQSQYNSDVTNSVLNDCKAAAYLELGQKERALECVNRSISLFDNDPASHALKGLILGTGKDVFEAYDTMRELIGCKSEDFSSPFFRTEDFNDYFDMAWRKFSFEFLNISIDQRKFIYLTSDTCYIPKGVLVLSIHDLPQGIEFKGGLSMEDTLYVMHPYKHNCYIPAKSYELELFRDEVDEFEHIMDCLGAKHISYSDERSIITSNENQQSIDISGGAEYNAVGGSGKYGNDTSLKTDTSLTNKLKKGTDFDINTSIKPYIPHDVVWYQNREQWRRDCQSRLEGRFRKRNFTISSSTTEIISSSEKKNIEAEIKALNSANGNVHYNNSDNLMSSNEANHTWSCEVEFYPMSEYLLPARVDEKSAPLSLNMERGVVPSTSKKINWVIVSLGAIIACLAAALVFVLFF